MREATRKAKTWSELYIGKAKQMERACDVSTANAQRTTLVPDLLVAWFQEFFNPRKQL